MTDEAWKPYNTAEDIVQRIMTQHWDMYACPCWICKAGRRIGLRPQKKHLLDGYKYDLVRVKGATDMIDAIAALKAVAEEETQ